MYTLIGSPLKSLKFFLTLFILTAVAICGNFFNVPLSPGVDFVFGSIAVLITVYLYGTLWGGAVALIGGIYTYFLWNHPYAAIIFITEALFVGFMLKRREGNLLLIDGLYWITVGIPLGFLFYYGSLGMNFHMVLLIILKFTVNGVFNALLANFVLTYLPFSWIIPGLQPKTRISFHTTLFNVFVALVLIPPLILLFMQSRHEFSEMELDIKYMLKHQSDELSNRLVFWRQQHEHPLKELASFISHHEMKHSPELQQNVVNIKKSFPEFLGVSVCDKNGISIAIYPDKNITGKSVIGLDFSDRDYFINARSTLKSYVSPVFQGQAAIFQPVIAMSVPVIADGKFKGIVTGALDLSYITKNLNLNAANEPVFATVVDSNGRVISSTKDNIKVMTNYNSSRSGEERKIDSENFQWFPEESKDKHQAIQWQESVYETRSTIGPGSPWTLIIQVPVEPFLMKLHYNNIKIMIVMLALVIIAVVLSKAFTQWMAKPISSLASFTSDIPDKLESGGAIEWLPPSHISEIDSLINNFRSMSDIVQMNFKDLQNQYNYSSALNRLAGVIASNDDTRTIIETTNKIVGETLDVDLCLIYDINVKDESILALTEWYNPKYSGRLSSIHNFDLKAFAICNEYVLENQTWIESHFDEVASCLADDVAAPCIHCDLGIKSLIWYPFSFHEEGYLVLAFNQINERRTWSYEDINFVAAAAQQVEIAVQKTKFLNAIWEEKERAQVTLHSIGDAVITTDAGGKVEFLNPVAENLTGWSSEEARGLPLTQVFEVVNEETGLPIQNPVDECLKGGRVVGLANHTVLIHRSGSRFAIEDSAAPIRNKEGKIIGVILVFYNVTEKRELMRQLTQLAYHDPLTQLPNRVLFHDRLSVALAKARRNSEKAAVLFLDLDRFKLVNDMFGHVMGDCLLKEVAIRLSKCMRQSDTIARLGGDEFTFLIPEVSHAEDAARIAQKILDILQEPFYTNRHEFHVSASIGISLYPEDGDDAETLMRHADMAMYRAKEQGLNSFQLYTAEMNNRIIERLDLEQCLRKALENMDFTVYYQPQVNALTGRIGAMEALVRWKHPDRGIISPDQFIPLAEDTGLILPIGEWVLRTACAQNKAWQDAGYPPMTVTVNISACQFRQKNLTQLVAQVLKETELDPKLLEVEITESVTMNDADFTSSVLRDLKSMGVQIAIDDFGTGHSSLSYLKSFPINTLKIDRSFIRDVAHDPEDAAIVTTIIAMAQNLNLSVIAEGVETSEQVRFLVDKQCEKMQGYYFSKPVPPEEFEKLITHFG